MNAFFKSFLLLTLFPLTALANDSLLSTHSDYSVGLDLGIARPTNLGNATTFPLGYSTFSYGSNTKTDVDTLISGISINKLITINPLYTLQVGVSAHYLSTMGVSGNLAQGISPPFYQASYSYSVNSYQYLVDAKLRRQFYDRFLPYVYLGVGVASNRAYGFSTTVPASLTVTPQYSNNTINSFSYSLGLGLDYFVKPTVSIGLGYRFINIGKVGLGSGMIRTTNVSAKLTQSNVYINTLLVELNYYL